MPIPTRSLAGVLVVALLASGATAAARSPAPSPLPPMFDDTAIPATPTPGGIVEPTATTWDHVTIWPDGQKLTVAFWNGAEACSGLDHIEMVDDAGTLRMTPWIGARMDAAGADCADIRQLYSTVVSLDAPILAGGDSGPFEVRLPPMGGIAERGGPFESWGATTWTAVDLGLDGRSGWAFFTVGDPSCDRFDHVKVDTTATVPELRIVIGLVTPPPEVCTMIAMGLRAPFTLPVPILLGGDPPPDRPSG